MNKSSNCQYGLVTGDMAAAMTGRELLQAIIEGRLPQAPISQAMSFWLVEVGQGFAAFEGEPGPHLLNPMGTVHGGWALTLIDSASGCAALSLLPAGTGYTTVETKANFSRPIMAHSVLCEPKRGSSHKGAKSSRPRAGSKPWMAA